MVMAALMKLCREDFIKRSEPGAVSLAGETAVPVEIALISEGSAYNE
jgi:hypothetical protein